MINKNDRVLQLYTGSTFEFDTALPNNLTTRIVDELIERKLTGWYGDGKPKERHELWAILHSGCVYAYCRISGRSGLLPITNDAINMLYLYNESTASNVIFTPILE
jgi:hypothetical protein